MKVRIKVIKEQFEHLTNEAEKGSPVIALQGGRRSGKTFAICQFLLMRQMQGESTIIAVMTAEQGKAGAYEDCKTIIRQTPMFDQYFKVLSSPREIRCKTTDAVIAFRSFEDSERAKGGACDWMFLNEANKFTIAQYNDLAPNARKGVILDYNPQTRFWVDNLDVVPLVTSWKQNPFLTQAQRQYFENLKLAIERPNASSADWYYYNVYYCGKYSELSGGIFTRANIQVHPIEEQPQVLHDFIIYSDPSAQRGGDYFATVFCALDERNEMWVLDVDSNNNGTPDEKIELMRTWGASQDGVRIFCETYGLVGSDFFQKAWNAGLPMEYWNDNKNKFERIVANYQDLTRKVHFLEGAMMSNFLSQVYEFGEKCDHDDNIDAVNAALKIYKTSGLMSN